MAGAASQQDHPAGSGAGKAHDPERIGERERVEQEHHSQSAEARAHQIHAIERAGAGGMRPEG